MLLCTLVIVYCTTVFTKQEAASQMAETKKSDPSYMEQLVTNTLEHNNVQTIQVQNNSGLQRDFSINDGFQERVLRKVVYWLNNSERVIGSIDISFDNPSNKMTLKMKNGKVITIEPAYLCLIDNENKICTPKEGELIVSENGEKVQLKSQSLYDWLMVGWRQEVDGSTKEELLEEALFTRYLYHLGPSYSEFFVCPKINIEPIDGDPRRHLIFGSALNYSGHHDGDYDQLTFSISDSNQTGLQVTNVKIKKHISEEEVKKQCRTFD